MKLSEELLSLATRPANIGAAIVASLRPYLFVREYRISVNDEWFGNMSDDHARLFCLLMAEVAKEEE